MAVQLCTGMGDLNLPTLNNEPITNPRILCYHAFMRPKHAGEMVARLTASQEYACKTCGYKGCSLAGLDDVVSSLVVMMCAVSHMSTVCHARELYGVL